MLGLKWRGDRDGGRKVDDEPRTATDREKRRRSLRRLGTTRRHARGVYPRTIILRRGNHLECLNQHHYGLQCYRESHHGAFADLYASGAVTGRASEDCRSMEALKSDSLRVQQQAFARSGGHPFHRNAPVPVTQHPKVSLDAFKCCVHLAAILRALPA